MTDSRLNEVELSVRSSYLTTLGRLAVLGLIILVCSAYTGLLDIKRLIEGGPALAGLASEMMPPDFSNFHKWLAPILDTLCMTRL